ncbi:MAG: NADH-quinone oxidoreductase subunit G [Thiomicrospira sp.]|uniref:NADH-quinone oxidoreductase subunit NuoG n=1 Tax=Thiomicrospira sp. TaxID=935 RepID=UPI001A067658|nr:NADH-quinone oxidoreductase subunit NuoG [Thiomicrospira sp.]MBE0493393.1 NADH-quinone oxidoreductase subunit G [Thiomicrospira sp.]
MVKVEINGQVVEAREGEMLIDVADGASIAIPRFCYHKKLSIAANCRMCLVEVEGAPKAIPACATPVTDGMRVNTRSPKAIAAQKSVMEFLLINHPLDCPICDQGGECELQDVAMDYGDDISRYSEAKRIVGDRNVGSLIQTDMTRCIHCTRCVRFGQEIAGLKELGVTGRSEWMEIGTYIEKSIGSELSGNMIDLCPVGALTSKPFRYKARAWELIAHATISPHDSVGSNILVHTRKNEVMRVVPAENEAINETWISDRDRYSYEALNSVDRLSSPMLKTDAGWQQLEWESALEHLVVKLKPYLAKPEEVVVLVSPNATLEELYLTKKLFNGLGVCAIESRLRQQDFRGDGAGVKPSLGQSFRDIENLNSVFMVGSYLRKELPLLNNRVRKAHLAGAQINTLNPIVLDYNYKVANELVAPDMVEDLAAITKAAVELTKSDNQAWLSDVKPSDQHKAIAESLLNADKACVMLGQRAQMDENYSILSRLAALLAKVTGSVFSDLPMSANTQGASLLLTEHSADNLNDWLAEGKKVFINLGVEPEQDAMRGMDALKAMQNAELVINVTGFDSVTQRGYADFMLPMAMFAENAGTYINAQGDWQSFKMVANAKPEAKPLWKILRVLGNMFDQSGFDYVNTNEILTEIQALNLEVKSADYESLSVGLVDKITPANSIDFVSPYSVDALVRRSPALQATPDADARHISQPE